MTTGAVPPLPGYRLRRLRFSGDLELVLFVGVASALLGFVFSFAYSSRMLQVLLDAFGLLWLLVPLFSSVVSCGVPANL